MRYGYIHLALWLVIIMYWVAKAVGNKKTIQRFSPSRRLTIFVSLVLFAYVLNQIPGWPRWRVIPESTAVQIIAVLVCAAGVAFAIWARHILGRNWSANPTIKENHELITAGPYHYVRHPIYTGILLGLFGSLVLCYGRVADIIVFGAIAIVLHFKSKIEEGYMMQTFPDSYPEYRRRTKAIIPFVL